jgi:small conductance mechanosensitive channel
MIPAAPTGGTGFSVDLSGTNITFVAIGLLVLIAFLIASRIVSRFAGDQLLKRHVKPEMVVLSRRVVTICIIGLGLFAAIAFAFESANVAVFGLVLATIIAALGVQDLLKDYVSGYYVLLERHIRVGDRISSDPWSGTVTEIKLRVTLLRSEAGDLVIVPNSELFTKPVTVHNAHPPEPAEPKPDRPA